MLAVPLPDPDVPVWFFVDRVAGRVVDGTVLVVEPVSDDLAVDTATGTAAFKFLTEELVS